MARQGCEGGRSGRYEEDGCGEGLEAGNTPKQDHKACTCGNKSKDRECGVTVEYE